MVGGARGVARQPALQRALLRAVAHCGASHVVPPRASSTLRPCCCPSLLQASLVAAKAEALRGASRGGGAAMVVALWRMRAWCSALLAGCSLHVCKHACELVMDEFPACAAHATRHGGTRAAAGCAGKVMKHSAVQAAGAAHRRRTRTRSSLTHYDFRACALTHTLCWSSCAVCQHGWAQAARPAAADTAAIEARLLSSSRPACASCCLLLAATTPVAASDGWRTTAGP